MPASPSPPSSPPHRAAAPGGLRATHLSGNKAQSSASSARLGAGGGCAQRPGGCFGNGGSPPPWHSGQERLCQGLTVGVCLQQPQPCPLPVRCHPEATRAPGPAVPWVPTQRGGGGGGDARPRGRLIPRYPAALLLCLVPGGACHGWRGAWGSPHTPPLIPSPPPCLAPAPLCLSAPKPHGVAAWFGLEGGKISSCIQNFWLICCSAGTRRPTSPWQHSGCPRTPCPAVGSPVPPNGATGGPRGQRGDRSRGHKSRK